MALGVPPPSGSRRIHHAPSWAVATLRAAVARACRQPHSWRAVEEAALLRRRTVMKRPTGTPSVSAAARPNPDADRCGRYLATTRPKELASAPFRHANAAVTRNSFVCARPAARLSWPIVAWAGREAGSFISFLFAFVSVFLGEFRKAGKGGRPTLAAGARLAAAAVAAAAAALRGESGLVR